MDMGKVDNYSGNAKTIDMLVICDCIKFGKELWIQYIKIERDAR